MITPRKFWIFLFLVTLCTALSLLCWHIALPNTEALSLFTWFCVAVFVAINVIAYYVGIRSVHSKSKYRFIHLMMALILFKMIICIGLVIAHVEINHPGSKLFVLPFLTTYLIFTFFEIYVLDKIARTRSQHPTTSA